ncbi:MAG: TrmB family transcriptional regulator sugar-binding domain-containing protein, partial [Fidelibacterota bacterium]
RILKLEEALDHLDTSEEAFDFWHLHGYQNLMLKLRETIQSAQQKVFLSAWAREVAALEDFLDEANRRGVAITLFSFCRLGVTFGETVTYDLDERELRKIWNPKIILVADQSTTVMGSSANRPDSRAIWTRNRAITEIATNHIILDITLAGQRLNFDPNPIVQRVMKRPDLQLDTLLADAND